MTATLLLPVAGQSSRFPGMRPKWLLTMPDGLLMIEKSVESLNLNSFQRIVVVCLEEHVREYSSSERLLQILQESISPKIELLMLTAPTSSQAETIAVAIKEADINGSILIKDCDNSFEITFAGGNEVAVANLHSITNVNAGNKSYVQTDPLGVITNIVEKHVIGNLFCCGAYGFASAATFVKYWNVFKDEKDLYISHIIFQMIMDGIEFQSVKAEKYVDWGTLEDYRSYCSKFLVIFCDVDGVLLKNSSKFSTKQWDFFAIEENIAPLRKLQSEGRLFLVLTSSRPESTKEELLSEFAKLGLEVKRTVLGLPHGTRLLINDYSQTNSYPSAIAINLERNHKQLPLMLAKYM